MTVAYLVTWTEFERSWGRRPDGYSLHPTKEGWDAFYKAYAAKMPATAPDEYSNPSAPFAVEIDDVLAEKLAQEGSLRYSEHGLAITVSETGARFVRETNPTPAKTFIELCLEKKASPEDVNDYIELWHTGKGGQGLELREYLGMTKEEYAAFIQDAASLYKTLYARMTPAS